MENKHIIGRNDIGLPNILLLNKNSVGELEISLIGEDNSLFKTHKIENFDPAHLIILSKVQLKQGYSGFAKGIVIVIVNLGVFQKLG
jgi:hypothetical protein